MEELAGTQSLFVDDFLEDTQTEGSEFEMKKTFRKQNKKLSFEQIKDALTTTHTLSTRMICEYLKTYRPWVSKYILPKLDKIYIPNGRGNSKSFVDWTWWLRNFNGIDIKESSWYKKSDFETLMKDSLKSCTRQTISVSMTIFMDAAERPLFLNEYLPLDKKLADARIDKDWKTVNDIMEKMNFLYRKYLGEDFISSAEMYWNGCMNIPVVNAAYTKRTDTAPVPYGMEIDYTSLSAVHDLKGYGGIDEEIYRTLFANGAIRLVYNFTADNGDKGEKIFYCYDKKDETYRLEDNAPVWTVPYSFFLQHKKF